ncbi:muscle M-line assembly protein unc-89-like protein isoform X1 [Tanacetum coccineum]
MSSAYRQGQVTTPYCEDQSVMSCNNRIGRIMVAQESLFKSQVRELHALYKTQLELMDEYKVTMIWPIQEQFESTGKLVKNPNCDLEGTINTCEIAKVCVTPKLMNPSTAHGKQVDQERSIIDKKLDVMSSSSLRGASGCLLWFANVVTSVEADLEIGQSSVQFKESRRRYVVNWGRIKKGKRSRRALLCIGMEKNVHSKHSRRHSTGNFFLESNGYEDVLSRYLSGPFPSCHDHCKPHLDQSNEPKSTPPTHRSNKAQIDSVKANKKHFTPIPRSPTKHTKISNTSVAKQVTSQLTESKRQGLKSKSNIKSKSEETDPFYIPPTKITRRFSDIVTYTSDLEDILGSHDVNGLTTSSKKNDKKIKSRRDLKSVKSRVKTAGNGTISKRVETSKSHNNLKKTEVDQDSINSELGKAVVEIVQEKTDRTHSLNEEKVLEIGQNAPQTPSDSQNISSVAASGVKKPGKPIRVGKLVKENEASSSKLKFRQGKTTDAQPDNGGPRKLKFGQGKIADKQSENGPGKVKFSQGKLLDENQNGVEDSVSLRRLSSDGTLPSQESSSVDVVLKRYDQEVNKSQIRTNNVIEEAASKLIRTRKSKVQALVGAFEMISTNDF